MGSISNFLTVQEALNAYTESFVKDNYCCKNGPLLTGGVVLVQVLKRIIFSIYMLNNLLFAAVNLDT